MVVSEGPEDVDVQNNYKDFKVSQAHRNDEEAVRKSATNKHTLKK